MTRHDTADAHIPRATLDAARGELRHETLRRAGRRAAAERYTDRVDEILQRLFYEAPAPGRAATAVALGGYGRRHLTLHSDIDLLVLFDGPLGAAEEQFVRSLLNPLWDLPLVVGHQVRE